MTSYTVPDFLIVGSMKAGTTTLYRDLVQHPDIFLPQEKEPETLVRFGEDDRAILEDYRSLMRPAATGQICGEASTAYTKRPDHEGVAERALRICGAKLKIIYLTREPISRIVSQYRHELALGLVQEPLNQAVLANGRYVAYSRYDWQLAPWLAALGPDNVLVLRFEDYVARRAETVGRICQFLGVSAPAGDFDRAFNTSEGKMVPRGLWKAVVASRFYQRQIKPLVPVGMRERMAGRVLTPVQQQVGELEPQTRERLAEALRSAAE
ncbi:sulfotransferase family protein [Devosia ginsengisoli]|uniref:Sulfotransferase domain-containing protein n=1 Tax=Devosia ginsengisoli TaxID=400770 RepID=A0A5B8LSI8_9HYPH|nr:sulfotransferase [Devosia ginsengisoli]QDZ10715.1 sulfotransferase domain-containing protein [Devosia ginsengisoli]